jgi:5,10-methylenetetrahydromethanopterin reductase
MQHALPSTTLRAMRIDVILESNNTPERIAELGQLAERHGLGGVWVSNMNDARDPFINFVDLARSTRHIRIGPIAVSPFELHPLKMASSLLTLNEVSGGRAQIVVGAGGGTATAMNAKQERRVRAMRECVEILKAASAGQPVKYPGQVFQVRWYNPSWVRSAPPLIYAGANGPQMLSSTARYADGIMVSDFTIARVREARARIDAGLAAAGRPHESLRVSNFWAWHVKPTREEAEAEARTWLAVRGTLYPPYIHDVLDMDEADLVNRNIDAFMRACHSKSPVIEGVPEGLVDKLVHRATSACSVAQIDTEIERLREFQAAGLTEIALRIYANPAETIRVIGERVVPALR